ncbi:hypothetical protein NDN08_004663 [Rhodosorus marinus]|uniref:ShKT domain-containing protein n=1 Tax=Rhodosorus marinus TaxID=101924 RepID=A0AAV8ULW6_9RHOD|nr:hypothetical protein NDN08_004663 [Rhodosorus marinus]
MVKISPYLSLIAVVLSVTYGTVLPTLVKDDCESICQLVGDYDYGSDLKGICETMCSTGASGVEEDHQERCKDTHENCQMVSESKEWCDSVPFIRAACPRSCGICSEETTGSGCGNKRTIKASAIIPYAQANEAFCYLNFRSSNIGFINLVNRRQNHQMSLVAPRKRCNIDFASSEILGSVGLKFNEDQVEVVAQLGEWELASLSVEIRDSIPQRLDEHFVRIPHHYTEHKVLETPSSTAALQITLETEDEEFYLIVDAQICASDS